MSAELHPSVREAIDMHAQVHRMPETDYVSAMNDFLGLTTSEYLALGESLGLLIHHMQRTPMCLCHAAFLAGVIYGRDYDARDLAR